MFPVFRVPYAVAAHTSQGAAAETPTVTLATA